MGNYVHVNNEGRAEWNDGRGKRLTTYTRGNGEVVEIKSMSDHHLLAAIRKLRKAGKLI